MLRRRVPPLLCFAVMAAMAAAGIGVTNEDIAGDRGFAGGRIAAIRGPLLGAGLPVHGRATGCQ